MRPINTSGRPGTVAPITPPDGSSSRARCHSEGAENHRCGSLASSGASAAVREGPSAQALEAPPSPGGDSVCAPCGPCGAAKRAPGSWAAKLAAPGRGGPAACFSGSISAPSG